MINAVVFGSITAAFVLAKVLLSVFIEDNKTSTLIGIIASTFLIAGAFKLQHWGGQNEILISGALTLVLWFVLFRKKA